MIGTLLLLMSKYVTCTDLECNLHTRYPRSTRTTVAQCTSISSHSYMFICDWICKNPPLCTKLKCTKLWLSSKLSMHSASTTANVNWSVFWRGLCRPCKLMNARMALMEGTNWVGGTWNCPHC